MEVVGSGQGLGRAAEDGVTKGLWLVPIPEASARDGSVKGGGVIASDGYVQP